MIPAHAWERSPNGGSRSGDLLLGQLALVVVLCIGLAGIVCWCGAQLGAVVTGHGWVRVSAASGGSALLALPHHLAEPAAAWPAGARSRLPGPIIYWICSGVVAATVAGSGASIALWWWRRSSHRASALGIAPHAGFARTSDLRRLTVRAPEPGRLTLGHSGRHLLAAEPRVSLAVIGPTGSGKTVGFAIPALLEWKGPIIATSVKADLIAASYEHRKTLGKVWVYDPTESSTRDHAGWSPLDACGTWPGAMRMAAWLCEAAQPRVDTVNDGDYWYSQARRALAPYLYAAALSGQTMRDVVRWIDGQEQTEIRKILDSHSPIEETIRRLTASEEGQERRRELRDRTYEEELALTREMLRATDEEPPKWSMQDPHLWPIGQGDELAARVEQRLYQKVAASYAPDALEECRKTGELDALVVAQSLWKKEERLRGSIFATAENVIAAFADPGVGRPTDCNIDFDAWLAGDNTIYVVAASHEQARLRPVLTVLVQQALRRAYDVANTRGGTLEHPCLALLDEAGNIAPLRDLPGYASTARSHGITLVSIWQDVAQLKTLYGHRAQTVLNNHGAKLFGTGIADDGTLEYVSRLIGDERHTELNVSDDVRGGRRTISEHVNYRRTAPIDMLRRIRRNEAVLLYGSELPVHLRLRPWYELHS
jgi:type IV secretion system protein VirD4